MSDTLKEICDHSSYTMVKTNDGDGIDECITANYKCKTCGKILGSYSTCISATYNTIYDREWASRNNIRTIED